MPTLRHVPTFDPYGLERAGHSALKTAHPANASSNATRMTELSGSWPVQ